MAERNQIIDFIRGFSILSVILLHCRIHLPIDNSLMSIWWIKMLLNSGGYGVIIFFVISGFLITNISIRRWNDLALIDLSKFYQIRFARIMPCLLAAITVASLLHLMNVKGFVITNTSLEQAIFQL